MEVHEEQRATALLVQRVPECTEATTALILHSSPKLHNPSRAPPHAQGKAGDGTGQKHLLCRERKFHLPVWGEDSSTNSSWFPFSPPRASKVFICPLLTGKQVGKGQSLSHPASRCCSSRGFLAALVGSTRHPMDNSCLIAGRASQPAVGSSTSHPTGQHYTLGVSEPRLFLE